MSRFDDPLTDYDEDLLTSSDNAVGRRQRTSRPVLEKRSVLYYFEMADMSLLPTALPSRIKITDVAVGGDHVIVVTTERMVYTWGEGVRGQLGHGDEMSQSNPLPVQALKGKSIIKACCGDGFSVFVSDNGIVMTCGDGSAGCLAHGDWLSTSRPRLIEALLSVDVTHIACGPCHVVAIGNDKDVFTWGNGADGRLGLGSEQDHCQPMQVSFAESFSMCDCFCGADGTMLLIDVGTVLACGNNHHNKLGLNQRQGFLMAMKNIFNKAVDCAKTFTVVKSLVRHRVVSVAMGRHHTAVVVEPGHVYMLGRNTEGQLGPGNTRPQNAPVPVKVFEDRPALKVRCGVYYTVAATVDNDLLFWGTRYKVAPPGCHAAYQTTGRGDEAQGDSPPPLLDEKMGDDATATATVEETQDAGDGVETNDDIGMIRTVTHDSEVDVVDGDCSDDTAVTPRLDRGFRPLSSGRPRGMNSEEVLKSDDTEIILIPLPLIRMDSSGSRSEAGDTVSLSNVFCHADNLFIQVETSAPPPRRKPRRRRKRSTEDQPVTRDIRGEMRGALGVPRSASSRDGGDEYSSEASELETRASMPTWLKQELASAKLDGNEAENTSEDESSPLLTGATSQQDSTVKKRLSKVQESDERSPLKPSLIILDKVNSRTGKSTEAQTLGGGDNVCVVGMGSRVRPRSEPQMSSSSSSDTLAASLLALRSEKKALLCPKHPSTIRPTKAQPLKCKAAPVVCEKVSGRHHGTQKGKLQAAGKKMRLEELQVELARLSVEKSSAEARVKQLKEANRRQHESLSAGQRSEETERSLALEVERLRGQLQQQSDLLHRNESMVIALQEQMTKLQDDQDRWSTQQSASDQSVKASRKRESRICVVQ